MLKKIIFAVIFFSISAFAQLNNPWWMPSPAPSITDTGSVAAQIHDTVVAHGLGADSSASFKTLSCQNCFFNDTLSNVRDTVYKILSDGTVDSIIGGDSLIIQAGPNVNQEEVDYDKIVFRVGGRTYPLRAPLANANMCFGGGCGKLSHLGGGPSNGYFNTTFGNAAGRELTRGFDNTFVGDSAGLNTDSGYSNTAMGWSALHKNTSGYHNTAIGRNACKMNITGFENTCIGHSAMREGNPGNGNTSIGNEIYLNLYSGNYNIGLGEKAGWGLDTGSNNILIGYQTGYYLHKASGLIMIGHNLVAPDSVINDYMSIGNIIYAHGGLGNQKTPAVGRVSIGDSTDNGLDKFQVYGTARMDRLHLTGTASDTALKGTRLLVRSGSGTSTTPDVTIDELVVDAAGDGGITIATPSASRSALAFGSPDDGNGADIQWSYSNHLMTIGGRDPTAQVRFNAGNGTEVMRLTTTNTSIASFTGGTIVSAAATASYSSIRMPAGTAPTTCIAGGMWYDGTHFYGCTATGVAKQLDN